MLTRRDFLHAISPAILVASKRADLMPAFGRIDTHIHIHRDAPSLVSALKAANWRGLDIVVCPASDNEPFDLEEKLGATMKVERDSNGTLAWTSTFDARGFEEANFTERTIARLRRSFEDGAIGVKIWKSIGMSIKATSGAYLLPDNPALLPATHDRDWAFFSGTEKMDYTGHVTQGLGLPDQVLRKIFCENALRWFPGFNA